MADDGWAKFDRFSESECHCRCGVVFLSHARYVVVPAPGLLARVACPGCGRRDDLRKVSSTPEVMTIGGKKDG